MRRPHGPNMAPRAPHDAAANRGLGTAQLTLLNARPPPPRACGHSVRGHSTQQAEEVRGAAAHAQQLVYMASRRHFTSSDLVTLAGITCAHVGVTLSRQTRKSRYITHHCVHG